MKADLHSHSFFSDGTLSPAEVVDLAAQNGVEMLALTDHDSIQGLELAADQAQQHALRLIEGVEISVTWQQQTLHIVGLNIDPKNLLLEQGLAENCRLRAERAEFMLSKLQAVGEQANVDIAAAVQSQLPDAAVPTRTHIARALITTGLVKNMNAAFKKYLGRGKLAFVDSPWVAMTCAVEWIREAGGVAVLAHPMRYRLSATRLRHIVADFSECGGGALEVVTATQDAKQVRDCISLVNDHQLAASIGSDFHSLDQPWAMLGRCPPLPADVEPVWERFS